MHLQPLSDMPRKQNIYTQSIDETLVADAKAGEELAFTELWNRHSKRAFRTLCRITRNQQDAEDALQDSFLKAFLHLNSFNGQSAFSTWLTRIAINSALMILRKKNAHPETSMEWSLDCDSWVERDALDQGTDIEAFYVKEEQRERLRQAINQLHPSLRNVVEIRYANDNSVIETAALAGISLAATKSRLLRARTALRRSLQ